MKIRGEIRQVHEAVAVGEESATKRLEDPRLVRTEVIRKDQIERLPGFRLVFVVPIGAIPGLAVGDLLGGQAE
jgi:hypothetical protein